LQIFPSIWLLLIDQQLAEGFVLHVDGGAEGGLCSGWIWSNQPAYQTGCD
jgi:hypothetical protein